MLAALPCDLVVKVLMRLSPADQRRAATVCKAWCICARRLVTHIVLSRQLPAHYVKLFPNILVISVSGPVGSHQPTIAVEHLVKVIPRSVMCVASS
jgi:F-box-like